MRELIYRFSTNATIPTLFEVGGKGKALIEMTKAGFPVPQGIVLSTNFFEPWLSRIKATSEWSELLTGITTTKCNDLKRKALEMVFTEDQMTALQKSLKDLDDCSVYAVRSSSPEEDFKDSSFAGMYETYLNVTKLNLKRSIIKAFTSMLDFRVMKYKELNNITIENSAIAVIIQKQIAAEVSGIGFSLNPQNNCYDEAVINAGYGLCKDIVSGVIMPDSYIVEKVKLEILEKSFNGICQNSRHSDHAGIKKSDIKTQYEHILVDEQIFELTDMIIKCESYYNYPIDIEWAIEDGNLYLLQVRPITTYIPLFPELMTEPGQRKKLYIDTIGCSQGFSEQLSVLGLDLWAVIMDRIQGQGIMPAGEGGYLINVHGKQYFDVSNMLKGMGNRLAVLTLKSLDPIIRERKDDIIREYKALKRTKAMQQSKIAMLRIAFSSIPTMLKMFASPQKQHQKYVKLSNLVIGEIKSLPQNKPFDQLVQDGISILDPIIRNAVAYIPGQLAMGRIKRMFKNVGLENEISAICMDLASNPTAVMGKALFQLACDPAVKGTSEVKEFEQKIQNRSYSQSFLKKYDHYVYFYGDRCFKEIDIATSRVRHNPGALYKQLININTNDSQISKAVERKEAAYQRLRKEAERMGKTKKFAKNAALYENLFGFREMPKYLTVVLTGRLHEIAMEIGNEFLKEGRLESAEQVFELHLNEIAKAQKNKGLELMPLIQANIAQYKKAQHRIKWPTNIDSRGKVFYPIIKDNEGSYSGQAISSGIVTGKAKVLTRPYEKSLLPGEILVTITAEPAWTPIFINAAGIVLEVGGLLHHGAIIAREYGIPCVSGLRDATSIIKDGDLIEVDGTNGFVKIIE